MSLSIQFKLVSLLFVVVNVVVTAVVVVVAVVVKVTSACSISKSNSIKNVLIKSGQNFSVIVSF